MKPFILLSFFLLLSGCVSLQSSVDSDLFAEIQWIGASDEDFSADLTRAVQLLRVFAREYGWNQPVAPNFVKEIRHFETKDHFDSEIIRLTRGKMKSIPKTYVALMDDKVLRVVSWSAYQKIHPDHNKTDYIQVLRHELAHQLHVDLVGDQEMGPPWFYEGFAVVAAGQYERAHLSDMELEKVIRSEDGGSYPSFGSAVRHLMKKYTLPQLVELARLERKKFLEAIGYPRIR